VKTLHIGWRKGVDMSQDVTKAKQGMVEPHVLNTDNFLIVRDAPDENDTLIEVVEIRPSEQIKTFLGKYNYEARPSQFTLQLSPKSEGGGVVSRIVQHRTSSDSYELTLLIANYSDKIVTAELSRAETKPSKKASSDAC